MATEHPHEPKCATCRFFHQYDRRTNWGACYRYPPRSKWGRNYDDQEIEHDRPKVCKWDWCGEHEEASRAAQAKASKDEATQ
jgi:hypothetical protein